MGRSISARAATRREFLLGSGALRAGALLAACNTFPTGTSGGPSGSGGGAGAGATNGGTGSLTWWDPFNPLEALNRSTFEQYAADGGPAVDYTVYNPNDLGQALQLAYSSQQLPDVFALGNVGVPVSALVDEGWFAPLTTADEITASLPEGTLVQGLHVFDGELYSFPIFSPRQYELLVWFNRDLVEQAGLDPDDPPTTREDLLDAVRAVNETGTSGLLLPLAFPDRMGGFVMDLALTAGFPGAREAGTNGIDLSTGEYQYHHDTYVEAIEYLLGFQKEGLLFPASTSLDAREGRARWAAGSAGYFFDGPFNPGVVSRDFADFLPLMGVTSPPSIDASTPQMSRAPVGGTFWISNQTDQLDNACDLVALLATEDYQKGLAEGMDQPPLDLSAVAASDAHATYKRAIEIFLEQITLAPTPQARDGVSSVEAAMTPVQPGLGEIVQGAFSGQITDVRAALTELSEKLEKSRADAIAETASSLTVEDWSFPEWSPGTDFDPANYEQ